MRVKNHPWVRRMALDNWRREGRGTEHRIPGTEGWGTEEEGYRVTEGWGTEEEAEVRELISSK